MKVWLGYCHLSYSRFEYHRGLEDAVVGYYVVFEDVVAYSSLWCFPVLVVVGWSDATSKLCRFDRWLLCLLVRAGLDGIVPCRLVAIHVFDWSSV